MLASYLTGPDLFREWLALSGTLTASHLTHWLNISVPGHLNRVVGLSWVPSTMVVWSSVFASHTSRLRAGAPCSPNLKSSIERMLIDIKPDSKELGHINQINEKSKGTISVLLLSNSSFDPFLVDLTSLRFGRLGNEPSYAKCAKEGRDRNGDGKPDVAVVNNRDGHILWFANHDRPAAGAWKRYVITTTCTRAYDVALALHCPLGPIALATCLQIDAGCYNAFIQEQSLGIHYNTSNDLLDYLVARARERGIGMLFSPIQLYSSNWPDAMQRDAATPGFGRYFGKARMGTDPAAIAAQVNYTRLGTTTGTSGVLRRAVSEAIRTRRILMLCSYDAQKCQATSVLEAVRTHQHALDRRDVNWEIDSLIREEALRAMRARLEQATQFATVAELSAAIAHEINQPLAAVVTNAAACNRWLSAEPANVERARLAAERVLRDAKSASEVVDSVRALFKRTTPAAIPLSLNEVIEEVCALMIDEASGRGVAIDTLAGGCGIGVDNVIERSKAGLNVDHSLSVGVPRRAGPDGRNARKQSD